VNPTAPANIIGSQNLPQFPRVVTPAARSAATPRVPARAQKKSPRNLSQGDFLDMGSANRAIDFGNNHWTNLLMMNVVIHPATGKEMQYTDLMKEGLGNELGRLFQGIRDIQGTHTFFFVYLTAIFKDRKKS
jgi:hypothetical protein